MADMQRGSGRGIVEILMVDEIDQSLPAHFQKRTAAAKCVYDRMDEQQKAYISDLVERYKITGNAPDIQQQ